MLLLIFNHSSHVYRFCCLLEEEDAQGTRVLWGVITWWIIVGLKSRTRTQFCTYSYYTRQLRTKANEGCVSELFGFWLMVEADDWWGVLLFSGPIHMHVVWPFLNPFPSNRDVYDSWGVMRTQTFLTNSKRTQIFRQAINLIGNGSKKHRSLYTSLILEILIKSAWVTYKKIIDVFLPNWCLIWLFIWYSFQVKLSTFLKSYPDTLPQKRKAKKRPSKQFKKRRTL